MFPTSGLTGHIYDLDIHCLKKHQNFTFLIFYNTVHESFKSLLKLNGSPKSFYHQMMFYDHILLCDCKITREI